MGLYYDSIRALIRGGALIRGEALIQGFAVNLHSATLCKVAIGFKNSKQAYKNQPDFPLKVRNVLATESLLKHKEIISIGNWNVRTMYAIGKSAQIAKEMREYIAASTSWGKANIGGSDLES